MAKETIEVRGDVAVGTTDARGEFRCDDCGPTSRADQREFRTTAFDSAGETCDGPCGRTFVRVYGEGR